MRNRPNTRLRMRKRFSTTHGTSVSWATRLMVGDRAGDVPRPTGAAAEAIIGANWPSVSECAIEEVATEHQGLADQLNELGQLTGHDRTTQMELLRGAAGDAHYTYLTKMVGHDFDVADHFTSKVTTATGFAGVARGVKLRLAQIMETAGPEYDEAVSSGNPGAVATVLTKYQPEVQSVMMDAWTELKETPPPTAPPGDPDAASLDDHTSKDERRTAAEDPNPTEAGKPEAADTDIQPTDESRQTANPSLDGQAGDTNSASGPIDETRQLPGDPGVGPGPIETQLPVSQMPPLQMPANPMGGAGSGGGGGLGSGGSGLSSASGLGSMARPISPGSVPTTPASSATSPSQLAGNPLAQAASQFQSGLASGMGSSGAVPPSPVAPPSPVEPFASQPAVAAAPQPGSTQAAGPAGTSGFGPASGAPPPAQGGVGGAPVGGGAMMPPPMAGAAPVTPYSAPGAGTAGPTTPASAPAAPPVNSAAGGASAGATPVIAGATGAVTGAGVSSVETTNPDLLAAQHILAGLVKACQTKPIFWAVSVLRTPVGPQTLVAGSVGGGIYLPPEVFLPSTVRLAALDPALPFGWAHHWMGWQSPSGILAEHVEQLQHLVAGVRMSAMVTCELWPRRPEGDGDFLAMRHDELLGSNASPLTGCHRLTATDPALAARLASLDRGGDISKWVASELTGAVVRAAMEPDATGTPVAVAADAAILGLVSAGRAGEDEWRAYQEDVDSRGDGAVLMPEIHAPRDADDSPSTQNARLWYQHFYAMGRIAEMVKCWLCRRSASPTWLTAPSLLGMGGCRRHGRRVGAASGRVARRRPRGQMTCLWSSRPLSIGHVVSMPAATVQR